MKVWIKTLYRAYLDGYDLNNGLYRIMKHYGGYSTLIARFKTGEKRKYFGGNSRDVYEEKVIDLKDLIQYTINNKDEVY